MDLCCLLATSNLCEEAAPSMVSDTVSEILPVGLEMVLTLSDNLGWLQLAHHSLTKKLHLTCWVLKREKGHGGEIKMWERTVSSQSWASLGNSHSEVAVGCRRQYIIS